MLVVGADHASAGGEGKRFHHDGVADARTDIGGDRLGRLADVRDLPGRRRESGGLEAGPQERFVSGGLHRVDGVVRQFESARRACREQRSAVIDRHDRVDRMQRRVRLNLVRAMFWVVEVEGGEAAVGRPLERGATVGADDDFHAQPRRRLHEVGCSVGRGRDQEHDARHRISLGVHRVYGESGHEDAGLAAGVCSFDRSGES